MFVINPKYESLRGWINRIPQEFPAMGEVIYQARNEIRRVSHDGQAYCIKRYHIPCGINRMIYTYFRKPKAVRAYENAGLLNRDGFSTPEPVAYILEGDLLGYSYLVTVCSPLTRRFYEFREHGIEGYETLLDSLGQMAGRMNEQGILHKDFSPGNILFDSVDGEWKIELVDINRMRFGSVTMYRGCRNFARLWGDEALIERVARAYAGERGFNPDECADIAVAEWKHFWKHRK